MVETSIIVGEWLIYKKMFPIKFMEIISKVVGSLYPFQNQRWRLHRSDPMNKLSPTQNTPALQATLALPPQLVELKKMDLIATTRSL